MTDGCRAIKYDPDKRYLREPLRIWFWMDSVLGLLARANGLGLFDFCWADGLSKGNIEHDGQLESRFILEVVHPVPSCGVVVTCSHLPSRHGYPTLHYGVVSIDHCRPAEN